MEEGILNDSLKIWAQVENEFGVMLSNLQDSVTVWSGKQITVYELSGTVLHITGKKKTLSKAH